MHNSHYTSRRLPRQRGAALVVGLIMLVIVTLLAIGGMNTAALELIMAGNEQYRLKAFEASEAGIEIGLTKVATIVQDGKDHEATGDVPGSDSGDKYTTQSRYLGDDLNIPGFSAGKFVGFHYQIASTGTSARGAQALHEQGAFVIQNSGGGGSFSSITN